MVGNKFNVTFLKNSSHLKKKNRELRLIISSIQPDLNKEDVDATQLLDNTAITDESLTDDNINNAEKTVLTFSSIKKKKINFEQKLALFLDSRQQRSNKPHRGTDDEDLNFYKSTLSLVKTLNMDQKMQFRIQLMQFLQCIMHLHIFNHLVQFSTPILVY